MENFDTKKYLSNIQTKEIGDEERKEPTIISLIPGGWNYKIIKPNDKYSNILDMKYQTKNISRKQILDKLQSMHIDSLYVDSYTNSQLECECNDMANAGADSMNKHEEIQEQIIKKQKHAKFSSEEKLYIFNLYKKKMMKRSDISNRLFLNYSTVCNIIKEFLDSPELEEQLKLK
jgi:hypothetical protein